MVCWLYGSVTVDPSVHRLHGCRSAGFKGQEAPPIQRRRTVTNEDGDSVTDLVLGVEDGYLYFLKNPGNRR